MKREMDGKRKRLLAAAIGIPAILIVTAAAILIPTVVIPAVKSQFSFDDAGERSASGRAVETAATTETQGDDRDGTGQVTVETEDPAAVAFDPEASDEERYNAALALYEAGRYQDALFAFLELGDYRDSAEQAEIAREPLLAQSYDEAVALYEAGRYEEAYRAFRGLGGYRDCVEQAARCNGRLKAARYDEATSLFEVGRYQEALKLFWLLGGYKESEDYAEKCRDILFDDCLTDPQVGNVLWFGTFQQDQDWDNGTEPIAWVVLEREEDRILVISQFVLVLKAYNSDEERSEVTWETCTLREYLNGDFVDTAFSSGERSMIQAVTVNAEPNQIYPAVSAGNDTQDRVFLLSAEEAEQYFPDDYALQCLPTRYAAGFGMGSPDNPEPCFWWLRTPGREPTYALFIDGYGGISGSGIGSEVENIGVRPAMWIDLGS